MTAELRRHDHELLTTFGANFKQLFLARALARRLNTGLASLIFNWQKWRFSAPHQPRKHSGW